jgi:hypothetical protein
MSTKETTLPMRVFCPATSSHSCYEAAHAVALRHEEEKGYRRGLIDQVFTNG